MAHAASQIKKNKEVDVNALEDEKERKKKSRKHSKDQKKKVHVLTYMLLEGEWWGLWEGNISPVTAIEFSVCVYVCVKSVLQCQGYTLHLLLGILLTLSHTDVP